MSARSRWSLLLPLVGVVALGGCGRDDSATIARAQQALAPFKKELRATLEAALVHGPDEAIGVCAEVAPRLAAQASTPDAKVGRTSSRLRNPANAAPKWLDFAAVTGPRVFDLDDGRFGYAEPIVTQALCTTCHGKDVAPSILERLRARYPNDAAMGYGVGDVRGAFWVELAPTASR